MGRQTRTSSRNPGARPWKGVSGTGAIDDEKGRKWDKVKWALIKRHLGYSGEETELFRSNPKNEEVPGKGKELIEKEIVMEVVASKGRDSQHKEGDRIFFDGAVNLLAGKSPQKNLYFALNAAAAHMRSQ